MAAALGMPACTGAAPDATCAQPARPGDALAIFLTGAGKATLQGAPEGPILGTGSVAPADGHELYHTLIVPRITIGGISAQTLFSGIAPGGSALYQINTVVPDGVRPGDDVPLRITVGDTTDLVTIAVQPR
jgi:uncharacterized protein (TIGR03437 family)